VVEDPAIERDFIMFSQDEPIKLFNDEEMILTGPALIPDKLIYRRDKSCYEYNIVARKDVIKETAIKFFKDGSQNNTTLEHQEKVEGATYFESWIVGDPNNDKSNFLGLKDIPAGTWMVSLKIHDPELWKRIKNGEFYGFSIEGYFDKELIKQGLIQQKQNNKYMSVINKIINFLTALESEETKLKEAKLEDGTLITIDEATMEVKVINEDGSLTPIEDGEYVMEDGTKFIVKDGKKVEEAPQEEAPKEEEAASEEEEAPKEDEVQAEVHEFTLEDGTVIVVDDMDASVKNKETGEPLTDGHYVLDSGEEFDVKDGKIVVAEEQSKEELSKIKFGMIKRDRTEELLSKIVELESKIKELEAAPAAEPTAINEKKEVPMTLAEQVAYNIKKNRGLV
jgi:hypothetical protein